MSEYTERRDKFFEELGDKLSRSEIGFKAYESGYEQAKFDILGLIDNLDMYDNYKVQLLITKINELGRNKLDF